MSQKIFQPFKRHINTLVMKHFQRIYIILLCGEVRRRFFHLLVVFIHQILLTNRLPSHLSRVVSFYAAPLLGTVSFFFELK